MAEELSRTRAALIYLRRHPYVVRAVILDGVAPTAILLPLHMGEDADRAFNLMLNDCQTDAVFSDFWPRSNLPADYFDPVVSEKPVLVLPGELDPVTPPRWREAAAKHLDNPLHVVVPGAVHGISSNGCVPKSMAQFLDAAGFEGLDTSCVDVLKRPRFLRSFSIPESATPTS